MAYSSEETNLGIKNFRREFSGLVQSLSQFNPISPQEPLNSPSTFNTRFSQLSAAIKHCFDAAGDIAIRDKRYLETFLTGYANPIVSQVYNGSDVTKYTNFPSYNINGTSITFPESRVMYNVSSLGELNNAACYVWVFVDGVKLADSDHTTLNTAYGVKCFIKATKVTATSEVNIVVNRIFNTSKNGVKATVATTANTTTFLMPVNQLGTFYHPKYIKLFVKRGSDPKLSYLEIPSSKVTSEIDTTGTTLKVTVSGFSLAKNEVVHILNTIYWWKSQTTMNLGVTNEVEMTELQADGSYRPVPFSTIYDFDVFFNGYKLIPGTHYTIIKGGNNYSTFKLKLLIGPSSPGVNTSDRVEIFKNEAVTEDKDFIYVLKENLGSYGILTSSDMTTLPMCKTIGQCYIGGKRVGYDKIDVKHKRFITLNGVKGNKDVEYSQRIVSTLDIANVMNFLNTTTSETDLVAEWIGFDTIIAKIQATMPPLALSATYNKTVIETLTTRSFFKPLTAAVEQFRAVVNAYNTGILVNGLVLDPNVTPQNTEFIPIDVVDKFLTLDPNIKQYSALIINPNAVFTP